ncbi:cell division ATPase FtsA [Clostridium beijerinckii]|nr:cell division ATPase FtsA [Clostridium beijerinckii]
MESIVIADIGAGTTDIALFTDGIPKSINSYSNRWKKYN